MDNYLLSNLESEFGYVKYKDGVDTDLTKEGWFLLEIKPFSFNEDNIRIMSDIIKGKPVDVKGGVIGHLNTCDETNHSISSNLIKKALKRVKPQTFLVAVYRGKTKLSETPLAVVLEPKISYEEFPDHPHLNMGFYDAMSKFYFPDSLCLAGNEHVWGQNEKECLLEVFCQISIWLYRHLVWVATRVDKPKGEWIGPGGDPLPEYCYPRHLNPHGDCRCGSKKKYKDCHRLNDIQEWVKQSTLLSGIPIMEVKKKFIPFVTQGFSLWKNNVGIPSNHSIEKLKSILLS